MTFGLLPLPAAGQIRDGGIDPWNLGKGDWIYYMSRATNHLGGNVMSVTNENSLMLFYKSVGVRYIIVKAASSDYLFNGSYSFPQFNSHLVNIAHANGILIFGYNRSSGQNVPGEIAISDYVFNQGADGFVWDAESEWESGQTWIGTNGPALAWQLCSAVRSNWPTKFLAHAPFPIINYHSSFPYKEFGYWSDAVMPQIYPFNWTGVKSRPSGAVNWTDVNWYNWQKSLVGQSSVINGQTIYWTNAIKPLAPVNHVYGPNPPNSGVSEIRPEYVMEFVDYLNADPTPQTVGGYKGASFWRADLHGAAQWANIKASTIGTFAGIVNNIVIDEPNATAVGSWTSTRTFYNGSFYGNGSGTDTNSFGTNYLTKTQGSGSAYVQFTPNVVVPGDYKVYQWHPYLAAASASVPHIIAHSGGSTTVYANQQTNSGTWSLLGTFNFAAGTTGYIRVTDGIAESGAVAAVDGIKLVFVPPASVPAAPSGLSATALSESQISLEWTDNATNESAYIVARSTTAGGPYTNLAVLPLNATSYTNTVLIPATTYYYVVRATNFLGASPASAEVSATTPASETPPAITTQPQGQAVVLGET
ncbi:MAG TPA: fibronectin type III domain-containing protein, partial [Verrucomicrobiota bacterium]|nr:fibronectin type III domain-containing protein [Verrucomicrobiota bacterium]